MSKKKIMVVDDEPDLILTIKVVLEDLGDEYEVIGADSGMRCLELLQNNQIPDLILLDIMMPKMNGRETFERLKENPVWKNIPVVFLTAYTNGMVKDSRIFLGENYINKPFDGADFKRRIDRILNNTIKN